MKGILILISIILLFIITIKIFFDNNCLLENFSNNCIYYNGISDQNYKPLYFIDSIPSNDLTYHNDSMYNVEYNDIEYKKKMYNILNIYNNIDVLLKITDLIKWSEWIDPTEKKYNLYKKFIIYFNKTIEQYDIKNIYSIFKYFKYNLNNENNLLFNIDVLLYRDCKIYGKHINLIVYYNNDNFYIINLDIIGNVQEYNIMNNEYLKDINLDNYVNHKNKYIVPKLSCNNCDTEYTIKDNYVNGEIEKILINKLDSDYYTKNELNSINENNKYYFNQDKLKKILLNRLKH
tara:strand:- start:3498 stop:4367 length:870 start_codon:yes stop_codon:yes gene_type:complete